MVTFDPTFDPLINKRTCCRERHKKYTAWYPKRLNTWERSELPLLNPSWGCVLGVPIQLSLSSFQIVRPSGYFLPISILAG
jgi:hypothetical protein